MGLGIEPNPIGMSDQLHSSVALQLRYSVTVHSFA
jgi:hypothetical protein